MTITLLDRYSFDFPPHFSLLIIFQRVTYIAKNATDAPQQVQSAIRRVWHEGRPFNLNLHTLPRRSYSTTDFT